MRIKDESAQLNADLSSKSEIMVDIKPQQAFEIVWREGAQIDVKTALKYIKSGEKEIDEYVQTSLESALEAKQDVIEDLENIRSGANLGITSVQPSDLILALEQKQDTLVSGTSIKTINNQSLLGSGNIDIQESGAVDSVNGKTGTVVLSTNDLTNDSGYITTSALAPYALSSSLASVALSGDYDDLINKPGFMPDYSAGVSVSTSQGNTYTVPADGVIKAKINWSGSTVLDIRENNSSGEQLIYCWQQNNNGSTCYIPVSKDMVLYFTERNGADVQFYPYKGVQNA